MAKVFRRLSSTLVPLVAAIFVSCASGPPPPSAHAPRQFPNSLDYYPHDAHCLGLTGRVGVEVSCPKGRFENVVIIESAGPTLDTGVKRMLSDAHCTPGTPPDASGQLGIIFQLTNRPKVPPFEDKRQVITITGIYPPVYPIICR
jgi:outer membrane biosynthesis protein TonB